MIQSTKRLAASIKQFVYNALANGGAVFALVAVLIVGAFAEGVQPVERVGSLFTSAPAAHEPVDSALFVCPSAMRDGSAWTQTTSAPDPDTKKVMIECKGGGFVVTWFEGTNQFACLDRNVRPYGECDATEVLSR